MARRSISHSFLCAPAFCLLAAAVFSPACSAIPEFGDSNDGAGASGGERNGGNGEDDFSLGGNDGSDGNGDGSGEGPVCETASTEAELAPIFLAFAFDVSGSMGQYDRPQWWHDADAKWVPVRDAIQAFFEDDDSEGISGSMTFFPANDDKCVGSTYETPNVAMTALPATSFATAFDAYETEIGGEFVDGDWRGGTPTLAAFQGTSAYLTGFQAGNPDARFAVVMVTDGTPQGCTDSSIASLETAVDSLYDDGSGVRTYVIGIENPTVAPTTLPDGWADWGSGCGNGTGTGGDTPCTPPNALADLNSVADAGGTTEAFLIKSGNPAATKAEFRSAIDAIRTEAISCEIGIPEHPDGGSFDADKIDVSYSLDDDTNRFDYDPDCEVEGAWHYDDESDPTLIELCPATCEFVQGEPGIALNVDFLCEDRPAVVK